MSEPITLTERPELDALIAAAVAVAEAMSPEERAAMVEAQRQSWVRGEQGLRRPTESASPPRAPGASAHPHGVGVESGPGQPIDAREAIRQAMYAVEAMPADTRLTDAVNFLQHAKMRVDHFMEGIQRAPLNMIFSAAEINRLYALEREAAAEIRRLREQVKTERRAGIEAAATHLAATTATRHLADEVRARADAPAPDTKPMTFDQFVAEINRLAEREGATKPGKPYCDAEAWRQAYDDGCTPADAWEEEKQAGV